MQVIQAVGLSVRSTVRPYSNHKPTTDPLAYLPSGMAWRRAATAPRSSVGQSACMCCLFSIDG